MIEVLIFIIGCVCGFLLASYGARLMIENSGYTVYKGRIIEQSGLCNAIFQQVLKERGEELGIENRLARCSIDIPLDDSSPLNKETSQ